MLLRTASLVLLLSVATALRLRNPIGLPNTAGISNMNSVTGATSFWQVTDIHVDNTGQCSGVPGAWFGNFHNDEWGCGVSVEGLNATIDYMVQTAPEADFVFFTGDAPWGSSVPDAMATIISSFSQLPPQQPVYFLLGNHDFPGAPVGKEATTWYPKMAQLWGKWLSSNAVAEFSEYGYYSTPMQTKSGVRNSVRLVALNTEHMNHGNDHVVRGETLAVGLAQMDWLNSTLTLAAASNETVYIFGHVPPGVETAYANEPSMGSVLRPNWLDVFTRRYCDLMDFHAPIVRLQSFGHEHVDTFRLCGDKTVYFSVPSLSTGYPRTNPTVRLWHHSPEQGRVNDYTQYHMDLINSNRLHKPLFEKSYSFSEAYNLTDLSRASVSSLLDRFKAEHTNSSVSNGTYHDERRFFLSSTPVSIQPECGKWCQVQDLCDKEFSGRVGTDQGFTTCIGQGGCSL